MRQGCPLSPYLLILCAEILSIAIRAFDDIKGIHICTETLKVIQYADDLTLCLDCDEITVSSAIKMRSDFRNISGLEVNAEKSKVFRTGLCRNSVENLCPHVKMTWESDSMFILGLHIPLREKQEVNSRNICDRTANIKSMLNICSQRGLTF